MASKAVEKAMHAYLISEAETEERRAQRLRAVAAALEESLANGACVGWRPVLFDHAEGGESALGITRTTNDDCGTYAQFGVHFFNLFISRAVSFLNIYFVFAPYHRIKSTEAAADESEAARAIAEAQKAAHEYETVATVGHHEHVQHVHTSTEV